MTEVTRSVRSPYRNLWIVFALLIPATLLAFAMTYFKGLTVSGQTVTTLIHVHAALMVLWLLMLIVQAWFISAKRYKLHRWVGRSSFVIAPLIIITTLMVTHETLNQKGPDIGTLDARVEIYDLMQVIGFGLSWALAIVYRRRTPIHVRFMVSTIFAMGNAILFRIILNCFAWVPGLGASTTGELENVAVVNGTVLVLMLLALVGMDWRLGIRRSPFWLVTVTTVILHIGFFTFTKTGWWMSLVQWYADLP